MAAKHPVHPLSHYPCLQKVVVRTGGGFKPLVEYLKHAHRSLWSDTSSRTSPSPSKD